MNTKKHAILAALLMAASAVASAQTIEATQELVDLGQIEFQKPVTVTFKLKNTTGKSFHIDDIYTDCGCTTLSASQGVVERNASYTVTATYDARTMGHFTKCAYLTLNNNLEPLRLTIRGVVVEEVTDFVGGYPYTLGALMVDNNDIEFDDVNRGSRPYQTIHILNTSDQPAQPQVMHLPPYLSAEVSPTTIRPGRSGKVTVTLNSNKLRDFGLSQTNIYLGFAQGDKVSADKAIEVSAVLLPDFEKLSDDQLAVAPHIQLSTDTLDLGSFAGKKKLRGDITIVNTGKSTLNIRSLQMFTMGLQVSLNKSKIQPGESARLRVTAVASDIKTAKRMPRILMITNDPDNPKLVVRVKTSK